MFRSTLTISGLLILFGFTGMTAHGGDLPLGNGESPDTAGGCARKTTAILARHSSSSSVTDRSIDVTSYKLILTLDPTRNVVSGSVRMRARVVDPVVSTIAIDLSSPLTIDSVTGPAGTIVPVRYPDSYTVTLPSPALRGSFIELTTTYHGSPPLTGFGSFVFASVVEGPWIWSLSEPYGARDWWPCRDHQQDKADSVDLDITVPAGLRVGSNGILRGTISNPDGSQTFRWESRYPIATYLVSVTAGPFVEFTDWFRTSPVDSFPILNFVLPGSLTVARPALGQTVSIMGAFTALFGPYPFAREKYGHSQFGRGGAMEHQTMTSTTTFAEDVVSHELAHQWFGDKITCASWADLWLNEGFATYSEALSRERLYGFDEYTRLMTNRMNSALTARGTLYVQDTSSVSELFNVNRVYAKGATVLHMLRHVLGDSVFFRALRTYADDPAIAYGTASTQDFQRVCESVSNRPLSFFFQEWVFGEKYPRYLAGWKSTADGSGSRIDLHLTQIQSTTGYFTMPVDVRAVGATRDTTFVVWNDARDQTFSLATSFPVVRVEIDPGHWILREVIDANPTLPGAIALEQNYPNPFNGSTTILYRLPGRMAVTLSIFNVLGEEIARLDDGMREPGAHSVTWDGTDAHGNRSAGGVFFCRLQTAGSSATRQIVYLR